MANPRRTSVLRSIPLSACHEANKIKLENLKRNENEICYKKT